MTSALFGPDGTELPEPAPVLPDPLVGPGGTGLGAVDLSMPSAGSTGYAPAPAVPVPVAPTPQSDPDAERLRRAIAAALGEPDEPRTPPAGMPVLSPPDASPLASADRPPSAPVSSAPVSPATMPPATMPPATMPPATMPPVAAPPVPPVPPAPPVWQAPQVVESARTERPTQYRLPFQPQRGRDRRRQRNPLIQERITRPGSAWVGCLVALIFLVAVSFNALQALVRAVIDLFN